MDGVLERVVRWRVALLTGTLVGSAGFEVGRRLLGYDPGAVVSLVVHLLLPAGLMIGAALIARGYHPAVLVARPEARTLEVPPSPWMVLGAAGYTMFGARTLGGLVNDLRVGGDVPWSAGVAAFWILFMAALWRAALGRFGVRLCPAGIVSREVLGSVFVPWEALGGPRPAFAGDRQQVVLTVADPGLIRRRGLRSADVAVLPAVGVSAELLARTIHEYAHRPELRPAIGTAAEQARFQRIPQIAELTAR